MTAHHGTSVVRGCDGVESFLTCGVPVRGGEGEGGRERENKIDKGETTVTRTVSMYKGDETHIKRS